MIDIDRLRQLAQATNEPSDDRAEILAEFYAATQSDTIIELLDRLEDAESDALEQARLNDMGSEREAALIAKLEAAEKERDELRAKNHQYEMRLRKILEAPEDTMSNSKALAEIIRQARLALGMKK